MNILVSGGAGYIGSHTVVELLNTENDVVIIDDLSNSSEMAVRRIEEITSKKLSIEVFDLCDYKSLDKIFAKNEFDAVIHLAGLKAVGESVEEPLTYYDNNLVSTINLIKVMNKYNVRKLIFSSSATVYGNPTRIPIKEDEPIKPTNPYGQTKAIIEQILADVAKASPEFKIVSLRYFNPVGAHSTGLIGEDPNNIPNNLLPFVSQVAIGKHDKVMIFGDDYDTPDGTGVRDYIHVVDLALGHLAALDNIDKLNPYEVFNLGSGKGYSVKEVIREFEKASGKKIPFEVTNRRPGDIATCYADPSRANTKLHWAVKRDLATACVDAWRWQSNNPYGYQL